MADHSWQYGGSGGGGAGSPPRRRSTPGSWQHHHHQQHQHQSMASTNIPLSPPRRSSLAAPTSYYYSQQLSPPRRGSAMTMGVPPTYVGEKRCSIMSMSAASSTSKGSVASRKSVMQSMLVEVEEQTGWRVEDLSRPYADFVKYRRVLPEDLDSGMTWVDILSKDGKPLRRNAGLLRYMGRVGFADGMWVGLELAGPPLDNNANDGMVFGVRYFRCEQGRGLFIKHKWARRSFLQRPRGPYHKRKGKEGAGDAAGGPYDLSWCFGIEPSPLHASGILDVARTVMKTNATTTTTTTAGTSDHEEGQGEAERLQSPGDGGAGGGTIAAAASEESVSDLGSCSRSRSSSRASSSTASSSRHHHQQQHRQRQGGAAAAAAETHRSGPLTHQNLEAWSRTSASMHTTGVAAAAASSTSQGSGDGHAGRKPRSADQRYKERCERRAREKADQEVDQYFVAAMQYLESLQPQPPPTVQPVEDSSAITFLERAGLLGTTTTATKTYAMGTGPAMVH